DAEESGRHLKRSEFDVARVDAYAGVDHAKECHRRKGVGKRTIQLGLEPGWWVLHSVAVCSAPSNGEVEGPRRSARSSARRSRSPRTIVRRRTTFTPGLTKPRKIRSEQLKEQA